MFLSLFTKHSARLKNTKQIDVKNKKINQPVATAGVLRATWCFISGHSNCIVTNKPANLSQLPPVTDAHFKTFWNPFYVQQNSSK